MSKTAIPSEGMSGWEKYQLKRASRPFSMVVAVATCLQGIILGWHDSDQPFLIAALILSGGLLLQFAVNLINDYSDLPELMQDEQIQGEQIQRGTVPDQRVNVPDQQVKMQAVSLIRRNYRLGLICFALAGICGLILVLIQGIWLFVLCLVGLAGAYFYTQPPVNYKARGLGVPIVFWMMGILMIGGACYAMSGQYSWLVFVHSIPLSLLTAMLLLSNELRDYEKDRDSQIGTLTVRLGYCFSQRLYLGLVVVLWCWVVLAGLTGWHFSWLTILALPLLRKPIQLLSVSEIDRVAITPLTGRFYGAFSLLLLLGYAL